MGRQTPWQIVATSPGAEWEIEAATVAAAGGFATFATVPCQTAEEFITAGSTGDGIIAGNEPYIDRILAASTRVKVISCPAVGHDQIDVAAANAAGIAVAHVPDYCTDEVSDHALVLALQRRVPWPNAAIRGTAKREDRPRGAGDRRRSMPVRRRGRLARCAIRPLASSALGGSGGVSPRRRAASGCGSWRPTRPSGRRRGNYTG